MFIIVICVDIVDFGKVVQFDGLICIVGEVEDNFILFSYGDELLYGQCMRKVEGVIFEDL